MRKHFNLRLNAKQANFSLQKNELQPAHMAIGMQLMSSASPVHVSLTSESNTLQWNPVSVHMSSPMSNSDRI